MSSKVWKFNSTLSAFCCVVSRPTLPAGLQLADILGGKLLHLTTKNVFKNFGGNLPGFSPWLRAYLRVVI